VVLAGCLAKIGGPLPPYKQPEVNEAWEERALELEADEVYDEDDPWMGDEEQVPEHVPFADLLSGKLSVTVPHPMTRDHYITTIYVRDQDGLVLGLRELKRPGEGDDAQGVTVDFDRPLLAASVTAYAHCNTHDTWKAAPFALPAR
jgi:desulfoferrodoxin (superoxide reductase-like protein)